jgi:2-polyprenyl-3-methyl-5-hydroxy-6-metoxy-1,4-benzoquinol methylase
MISQRDISGYTYVDGRETPAHSYLFPAIVDQLKIHFQGKNGLIPHRVFDLGCGNGAVARHLATLGYDMTGVDPSVEGIAQAHQANSRLKLSIGSAYDDLAQIHGTFPAVISLEVVEHVYAPRRYAATLFSLVEPGGVAIVSTPYHSYFKNLALALSGKMDDHFTVLWDNGHIKFWSIRTLTLLLKEAGFADIRFLRVGRIPSLAKSMIAVARKSD